MRTRILSYDITNLIFAQEKSFVEIYLFEKIPMKDKTFVLDDHQFLIFLFARIFF